MFWFSGQYPVGSNSLAAVGSNFVFLLVFVVETAPCPTVPIFWPTVLPACVQSFARPHGLACVPPMRDVYDAPLWSVRVQQSSFAWVLFPLP